MTPALPDRVHALLRAFGPATVRDLALVTQRTPRRIRQVLPDVAVVVDSACARGHTSPVWGVR